jgi:hypothetical protein
MRFLLALIGLAAVVLIVLLSFGFLTLNGTPGSLPTVKVEGGSAPSVDANVAHVNFGSENKSVAIPTMTTTNTTVSVPTITVSKPGEPTPAAK